MSEITVIKRGGEFQAFQHDKLSMRIELMARLGRDPIDISMLMECIVEESAPTVYSFELDELAIAVTARHAIIHPAYSAAAGRLVVSVLHKKTKKTFSDVMEDLFVADQISSSLIELVRTHAKVLDANVVHNRDYRFTYPSIMKMRDNFLSSIDGVPAERPQHMYMRTALSLHHDDIGRVLETYDLLSTNHIVHSSETLHYVGTNQPHLSSCSTKGLAPNDLMGTFNAVKDCAIAIHCTGEAALSLQSINSKSAPSGVGCEIGGGIEPVIRLIRSAAQCTRLRERGPPGNLTINLEVWHGELDLLLNSSSPSTQGMNDSIGVGCVLWMPDIFLHRVERDESWSLFCPSEAEALLRSSGAQFNRYLLGYEALKIGVVYQARDIWSAIIGKAIEPNGPRLMFTDTVNRKSNEGNIGVIRSTNPTADKVQYAPPSETATCCNGSIILPSFITDGTFDYVKLLTVTKILTRNLDRVVEQTACESPATQMRNRHTRAIGINIQGLADAMICLGLPMESEEGIDFNKAISETIYYAAVEASCDLAESLGRCTAWTGSRTASAHFQFDSWEVVPSDRHDWPSLRSRVQKHGLRNLLLVSLCPISPEYNISGVSNGIDPNKSNIQTQYFLSTAFTVMSAQLVSDLTAENLWNESMRRMILKCDGSVQSIPSIPASMKALYKTASEIDQVRLIDLAVARGPYVCQSQSLTLYGRSGDLKALARLQFHAWKKGLKTGLYRYVTN